MLYALCPMLLLLERQLRNYIRQVLTRNAEIGYLFKILTGGIKGNGKSHHLKHIDIAYAISNGNHFFWFNMKPLEDPFHPLCLFIIVDLNLHLSQSKLHFPGEDHSKPNSQSHTSDEPNRKEWKGPRKQPKVSTLSV